MADHLMKAFRHALNRLWNTRANDVAKGAESADPNPKRAYAAGYRDGYFAAVADLVQAGLVEGPPQKCVVSAVPPIQGIVH